MPKAQPRRPVRTRVEPLAPKDPNKIKKPEEPASKAKPKSSKAAKEANHDAEAPTESAQVQQSATPITSNPSQPTGHDKSNYVLLVALIDTMAPTVKRLLSVPPSLTFDKFHRVLQIAFGWSDSHMHAFEIRLDNARVPVMYLESRPEWMGDMDLGTDAEDEQNWTLANVYEKPEWNGRVSIGYTYDHGDDWAHDVVLLGKQEPFSLKQMSIEDDMNVLCLSGEGHPVAEDCGGPDGWQDLKELFKKPKTKDVDDLKKWYKNDCLNGDPEGLNPWKWDMFDVNAELAEIGLLVSRE